MKPRLLLPLLLLLLLLLAACGREAYQPPVIYEESGSLEFYDAAGSLLGAISVEDIRGLDAYQRRLEIRSAGEGVSAHDFRGARLRDIIGSLDAAWLTDYAYISAIGSDDYLAAIDMAEVCEENNAFIMYEDDGQPLLTLAGEAGGMRLVMLDDSFGQRFTRNLVRIVLLNEEEMHE